MAAAFEAAEWRLLILSLVTVLVRPRPVALNIIRTGRAWSIRFQHRSHWDIGNHFDVLTATLLECIDGLLNRISIRHWKLWSMQHTVHCLTHWLSNHRTVFLNPMSHRHDVVAAAQVRFCCC